MKYQALLFDLDNTLFDFDDSEDQSLRLLYQEFFQQSQTSFTVFKQLYQNINAALWRCVESGTIKPQALKVTRFQQLADKLKLSIDPEQVAQRYQWALSHLGQLLPGVVDYLTSLVPHYQMAIITNGLTKIQMCKYQHLQLVNYFPHIIISEAVGYAKPQPEIFLMALDRLGVQQHQTLMIGDSLASDHLGAINVDMDFCWINPSVQPLPPGHPQPTYEVSAITELDLLTEAMMTMA